MCNIFIVLTRQVDRDLFEGRKGQYRTHIINDTVKVDMELQGLLWPMILAKWLPKHKAFTRFIYWHYSHCHDNIGQLCHNSIHHSGMAQGGAHPLDHADTSCWIITKLTNHGRDKLLWKPNTKLNMTDVENVSTVSKDPSFTKELLH